MKRQSPKPLIWTEERVRQELRRMDRITGLSGASLPIVFTNSSRTLGTYTPSGGGKFEFSRSYLEDPDMPEEINFDTIRHEYAHFMDWEMYGGRGHGTTWKMCCGMVNALPIRCYNSGQARHYRKMHELSDSKASLCTPYTVGCTIVHGRYGTGVIRSVRDIKEDRMLEVAFEDGQTRMLSARWVHEHCR